MSIAFRDQRVKQASPHYGATAIAMWAGGEIEHFSDFYNPMDHTFRYTGTADQNHAGDCRRLGRQQGRDRQWRDDYRGMVDSRTAGK